MEKGMSILIIILILGVIGVSVFAVLVKENVIKIEKAENVSLEEKVDIYENSNVDIYEEKINDNDKIVEEKETENVDIYDSINDGTINFVYSLEDKFKNDTVWCGTFNLIWNRLKNDLAKQDIVFEKMTNTVKNLNIGTFTENDLDEDSYYIKVDYATTKVKKEIEKAIKDKFNETSDILDSFNFSDNSKDYFLYTMLKKVFKFKYKFEIFDNGTFGDSEKEDVKYFGIKQSSDDKLLPQVEVLFYEDKDDFAIKLITTSSDEVILRKNPSKNTFKSIYDEILKKAEKYTGNVKLSRNEVVKIPNLSIDLKSQVKEVINKPFLFKDGREFVIDNALQTIKFDLDNEGGKIKSEAAISVKATGILVDKNDDIREFILDNDFVIFLIEEGSENPYFAANINDIYKFQK